MCSHWLQLIYVGFSFDCILKVIRFKIVTNPKSSWRNCKWKILFECALFYIEINSNGIFPWHWMIKARVFKKRFDEMSFIMFDFWNHSHLVAMSKNTMVFHLFQMEHINVGKNIWRDEPNTWDYHWLLVLICDYLQAHKDSLINKPSFVVEKRRTWAKRHSDSWLHAVFVLLSSDSVLCCCSRATIASR